MSEAPLSRIFLTVVEAGVATEFLIMGLATLRVAWKKTGSLGIFHATWNHQIGYCLTVTGIIFAGLAYRSGSTITAPFFTSIFFLPILFVLLIRPLITWVGMGWRDENDGKEIHNVEDQSPPKEGSEVSQDAS